MTVKKNFLNSANRKAFKEEILAKLDWMDEETRRQAIEKLDKVSWSYNFFFFVTDDDAK
jgi:predicted metalloendopeptidase